MNDTPYPVDASKFDFEKAGLTKPQIEKLNDAIMGLIPIYLIEKRNDPGLMGGVDVAKRHCESAIRAEGGDALLRKVKSAIESIAPETDDFLNPNAPKGKKNSGWER